MILTVTLGNWRTKRSNEGERESAVSASAIFSTCSGTEQTCLMPQATTFKPGGVSKKKKNTQLTINYLTEPTLFLCFFPPLSSSILSNRYDGLGYQCTTEAWEPVRCLLMFDSSNLLRPALMIHSKSRWVNMARRFTLHATQEAIKHTPLKIKCTPSSFDTKLRFTFRIFIAHTLHQTPPPTHTMQMYKKSIVLVFSGP